MVRPIRSTGDLIHRARELRRDSTRAELALWARLRRGAVDGTKFRRQHAIGRYVVDFCSPEAKLAIELDGGQHVKQAEEDLERTAFLRSRGYRVLRFWNSEVFNNIEGVVAVIRKALQES